MPYFRRAGHALLLVAATILTYGIGGMAYWLVKRGDRICPSCGVSWGRVRTEIGEPLEAGPGKAGVSGRPEGSTASRLDDASALPGSGAGRRVTGVVLALLALLLLGIGIVEGELGMAVTSAVLGVAGAGSFAWGRRALQQRREELLFRMQRRVLRLAYEQGGRLTATNVASALDLSLDAAERVLLSMDDGFRVRSDVTDEGLLVFEFPEIQLGAGGGEAHTLPGGSS